MERWSRKLRSIELTQPKRGLADLDELICDYWSVFVSAKASVQNSARKNSVQPEFEHEMRQLKDRIDRLGAVLVSIEDRSKEAVD